jgi:hypothetical protein
VIDFDCPTRKIPTRRLAGGPWERLWMLSDSDLEFAQSNLPRGCVSKLLILRRRNLVFLQ